MLRNWFLVAFVAAGCLSGQGNSDGKGKGKPEDPGSQGKSGDPGNGGDKGKPTDPGNSGKQNGPANTGKSIQWITSQADVNKGLLDKGTITLVFKSSVDLENLQVWLTPSLKGITADPTEFATVKKDTEYKITLTLDGTPAHTLGGTLHLQSSSGNSRTFAPPFPISIKVKGSDDGSQQSDATVSAVVNSADFESGSVSAGLTVSLFGAGLGPAQAAGAQLDALGRVSSYLSDTQVFFNGIPAPLLAVSNNQVNAIVPQGVASDDSAEVVLAFRDKVSVGVTLPVMPVMPALFTLNGSGSGQAAALNQDGSVNSPAHPARRGSVVTLFGSGLGDTTQSLPDGALTSSALPLKSQVSVSIAGAAAKVLYAGGAPGIVSGVVQINAQIPDTIPSGDKVTVVVSVGGKNSPASVTVSVN